MTRSHLAGGLLIIALPLITPSALPGQVSPRDSLAPLSALELSALVDTLAARLRSYYVDPAIGEQMAATLVRRHRTGGYARLRTPVLLADSMTADLRAVSHDEHMKVLYRPQGSTRRAGAASMTVEDSATRDQRRARFLRDARWDNYGLDAVRVFPGSVGYLEFHEFWHPQTAGPAVAAAMEFLRASHALIIDLRRNYGGHEGMIQLLLGYLLPAPRHLWTSYDRLTGSRDQAWSVPFVPGGPLAASVPVYVLTSQRTFSAAEDFAYALQGAGRATIIGERTRGGGNIGEFIAVGPYFDAFIPYGSTVSAITGASIEKQGVLPDLSVPADSALLVARREALRRIRASLSDRELIEAVDAAIAELETPLRRP